MHEALPAFDHQEVRWSWSLDRIHAKRYTDNVVDLMVVKLNRLPPKTLGALCHIAGVGSSAVFALLGRVRETSQEELHDSLRQVVRAGLVLRSEDFMRSNTIVSMQQATCSTPEDARAEAHLRIGRLLLAHTLPDKREEIIFEIVSQFTKHGVDQLAKRTRGTGAAQFDCGNALRTRLPIPRPSPTLRP